MKLKHSAYGRNHDIEEQSGYLFNKTSTSILFLLNIFLGVFLTPALITTSMIAKDTVLMIANIFLSAGYTTFFGSRLIKKEISLFELTASCLAIAACTALIMYFSPLAVPAGIFGALYYTNLVSTGINGFFLIRNIILPPLKRMSIFALNTLGFDFKVDLFTRPPLKMSSTLGKVKHEYAIDVLLRDNFNIDMYHDNLQNSEIETKIKPFNQLITTLSEYINKYTDSFFGSIIKGNQINNLTSHIDEIYKTGKAGNAMGFIQMKLSRKQTKINLLEKIQSDINQIEQKSNPLSDNTIKKKLNRYFEHINYRSDKHAFFKQANELISKEISRQKAKCDKLKACLPNNLASP